MQRSADSEWARDIAIIVFYGIFGALFLSFTENPERYDKCKETQFIDWNRLTMIVCLTLVGVSLFKLVFRLCNVTQKCPTLWSSLEAIGGIFIIICAIGLHVKDSGACGDLHTLAMVFYILVYISLGLAALFLCCSCLLCAGVLATAATQKNDLENQPINVQANTTASATVNNQYVEL